MLAALSLGLIESAHAARVSEKPPAPDFTQGGEKDDSHDWTLGPTGARGWIYGSKGRTAEARQILVTAVAPGSTDTECRRSCASSSIEASSSPVPWK